MAFLTHSQVELILFCKGFWHKAWIWLISWVRFSLRKSIGRIQPLTFGFQTAMKNKDIFSQDNKVINTAPSRFGFLEEINLQVSFYERSSFFMAFCLLLCTIRNECMCKLGGHTQYPCQCFRYNSQNSRFLILPFQRSPTELEQPNQVLSQYKVSCRGICTLSPLQFFVTLYLGISLDQSLSHWKEQSTHG